MGGECFVIGIAVIAVSVAVAYDLIGGLYDEYKLRQQRKELDRLMGRR